MSAAVDGDERRFRKAMRWPLAIGAFLFISLLWSFGPTPLHPGLTGGGFSGLFDLQAHAILEGHLNVEPGEADIEAFIIDGEEYLYFPPGPALIRLPIAAVTDGFDKQLTAPAMLIAWFLLALSTSRLMWAVRKEMRPDAPLGRWELAMYAVLHVAICAGSVVLFLASMPWAYHEVYMWSIAVIVAAALALIRLANAPNRRTVTIFGALVLAGALVRAPAGWGLAGAALFMAAWMWRGGFGSDGRRMAPWVVVAGLAPLAVGIAINWVKFNHPYLFPLEKQIFTGVSPHRRAALAANGGDLVSFDILPSTLASYLRPDGIRFMPVFPFISLPGRPAPEIGGSFIDQRYRTGSVTNFMPLLLGLSVWGIIAMFRASTRHATRALRVPLAATVLVASPVMIYGYLVYRYTAEFVPILTVGSIVGLTALIASFASRERRARLSVLTAVSAIALFSVAANMAAGISMQHMSNPGPLLQRYVRLQMAMSSVMGDPMADNIRRVVELPRTSEADKIVILGDCDAAFMGTGDDYGPWEPISMREWSVSIIIDGPIPDGTQVLLGRVGEPNTEPSLIGIELADQQFRVRIDRPDKMLFGEWMPYTNGIAFVQQILVSTEYRVYSVEPTAEDDMVVPFIIYTDDHNAPRFFVPTPATVEGVRLQFTPLANSDLCNDLVELMNRAS